ncbi:MAG TPA: response regulator transcription factor [Gemmatimonadales bacterium]|jgi:two-component system copper resistance phosphate regulon response regulator CusR|nr:response regulator transcription factor [Gemmatimonadales bacterium]
MRVLVVEDEARLAGSVAKGLRQAAHAVDIAGSAGAAREKLAQGSYDAVVLDVMLPDGSGFALVEELRAAGKTLPILMLTARGAVEDRVQGLDRGADDYLVKPFALAELVARLRALSRRVPVLRPETLQVSDLTVDTAARRAARGGTPIELTVTEWGLLEFLARHQGQVCSRSQISLHVWDEKYVPFSNVIDAYIARLRRKLDQPGRPPLLHTIRGAGYLLGPRPDS